MDDKGKKTLETGAFVLGGALLVWFVVASSGGGGGSSAPVPTSTTTAAPSDAAVQAGAAEYQSQLTYQSQVLQAGSATQAALINAFGAVEGATIAQQTTENTNQTNIALGKQNTDLQERVAQLAAGVQNYATEVTGDTAIAENTTAGNVAITQSNNTTASLLKQYEEEAAVAEAQAAGQLAQVQTIIGGQVQENTNTTQVQLNQQNQQTNQVNNANNNAFTGSLIGDALGIFGL